MKKKMIKAMSALALLFLTLVLLPVAKLTCTDAKIAKSLFSETYYVKIDSDEYDFDVFRDYMEARGWKEVDQMGGLHVFEKDGKRKAIANTQVKTVFVDGKLNFKLKYLFN